MILVRGESYCIIHNELKKAAVCVWRNFKDISVEERYLVQVKPFDSYEHGS